MVTSFLEKFFLCSLITIAFSVACGNNATEVPTVPFDKELEQLNKVVAELVDYPVQDFIYEDACKIHRKNGYKTGLSNSEMDKIALTLVWDLVHENTNYNARRSTKERALAIIMTGMSELFNTESLESYCNSIL